MPNPPFVPTLVSIPDPSINIVATIKAIEDNFIILQGYLQSLSGYIATGEPDGGWGVTGVTENKALAVGDTLTQTQHFLGTLIALLIDKGVLSA